jgi:hypothetical protein
MDKRFFPLVGRNLLFSGHEIAEPASGLPVPILLNMLAQNPPIAAKSFDRKK